MRTILFVTGLVSLAMEVAWTRMFVPFQGTFVYSFASILAVYLAATTLGSRFYRARAARRAPEAMRDDGRLALLAAAATSLLALIAIDPRLPIQSGALRVILGVAPVSAVFGFLTPFLMDRWAAGDPRRAGAAYALNTAGCIIGPILAGFVMLPAMSERIALILLAAPLFALGLVGARTAGTARRARIASIGLLAAALVVILLTKDFRHRLPDSVLRRDHTATVVAAGQGMNKAMFVNGSSITNLTPITKLMAHLPLAFHSGEPRRGLVLCFGMGTSFRSMMSWGIDVTAVELVPSVPSLFGYYHADAEALLASPRAHVVIDDARRFLERSNESFDVITIDPPPPVEAAGSSLLYSREFYETAKRRLAPGGILQQWLPHGEAILWSSVTKALTESFAHVRVLVSIESWGCHFLASDSPIVDRSGAELAARLPEAARADLIEWGPARSAEEQLQSAIAREHTPGNVIALDPGAPILADNRPVNEYFFLRRTFLGSKTMGE
jgi:spermidine synthase